MLLALTPTAFHHNGRWSGIPFLAAQATDLKPPGERVLFVPCPALQEKKGKGYLLPTASTTYYRYPSLVRRGLALPQTCSSKLKKPGNEIFTHSGSSISIPSLLARLAIANDIATR